MFGQEPFKLLSFISTFFQNLSLPLEENGMIILAMYLFFIGIFNEYLKEFPNSDYASHIEYLKHHLFEESMAEGTKF